VVRVSLVPTVSQWPDFEAIDLRVTALADRGAIASAATAFEGAADGSSSGYDSGGSGGREAAAAAAAARRRRKGRGRLDLGRCGSSLVAPFGASLPMMSFLPPPPPTPLSPLIHPSPPPPPSPRSLPALSLALPPPLSCLSEEVV
jgi:hypothetical protein